MSSLKRKRSVEDRIKNTKNKRNKLLYDEIEFLFELIDINFKDSKTSDVQKNLFNIKKILVTNREYINSNLEKVFIIESRMMDKFFRIERYDICLLIMNDIKYLGYRFLKDEITKLKKNNNIIYSKSFMYNCYENELYDNIIGYYKKKFKENKETMIKELELDEKEIKTLVYILAQSYYFCNEERKSIDYFKEILKLDNDYLDDIDYENYGACYYILKDYDKAIEIYNNITDNNKDLLIYRCNREKEKIQHNSKYLELYKKSVKIKDYGLSQELLYKVNIECCICMENTCNYLTRCYHTICLRCKDNIQGRCPICREPNWRI